MNSERSWPYRREKTLKSHISVFSWQEWTADLFWGNDLLKLQPCLCISNRSSSVIQCEKPFGHRRHFCLSCYCLPSTRGFHLKIERTMCCHTSPFQQSFQTSLSGGSDERVGLWSGYHWGTGMFSEALGLTTRGQSRQVEAPVCHPVPKVVPAPLLGLCKAVVVLPTGLFFCVSTSWCHARTVEKIKQVACGSWEIDTFFWTKERFVFLMFKHYPTYSDEGEEELYWGQSVNNGNGLWQSIKVTRMETILFSDIVRVSSAHNLCTVLM